MGKTLRESMQWLHTWAGLCLGTVLFAIFWMGTLSVFDREIDRWMMPATRLAPAALRSVDDLARELAPSSTASQWLVLFPSAREPVARVGYRGAGDRRIASRRSCNLDPAPRGRDARGHGLPVSLPLQSAPESLVAGALDRRARRHGHARALRLGCAHSSQDLQRFLHFSCPDQAAPADPRPAQRHRRARIAVSLRHHAFGSDDILHDLFSRRLGDAPTAATDRPSCRTPMESSDGRVSIARGLLWRRWMRW
jgi:hypothetical protein